MFRRFTTVVSIRVLRPLLITLFAGTLTYAGGASATTRARPAPNVVENGSDLVLYHFNNNSSPNIAFDPAGNIYAGVKNGVLTIAPDGTNGFIPAYPAGGGDIAFAAGFLWINAYEGVVRLRTDGSDRLYFQLGGRDRTVLTAGPDGVYFSFVDLTGEVQIARLSAVKPKLTLFPLGKGRYQQTRSDVKLVMGADGRMYFDSAEGGHGERLGRLETNGTITFFKGTNTCGAITGDLIRGPAALYYIAAPAPEAGLRLCRVTYAGNYAALSPTLPGAGPTSLTADDSGDVWTANLYGAGLYSLNVPTGKLSGPIDLGGIPISALRTGPDENVWFYTENALRQVFLGAYVRHAMAFVPTTLTLSAASPSYDFFVSEPVAAGRYSAVSLDPSVATVSPASSPVGRFTVTETGHGKTSIMVTDSYGNVSSVAVTAN